MIVYPREPKSPEQIEADRKLKNFAKRERGRIAREKLKRRP